MRRPADVERVRRTIEQLRAVMPEIGIRTTFLVGYPGETEAEFRALLDFVADMAFDRVGVFTYSYEEGTLVIDAYDSKEKKMVWRGSGTVTVKGKPDKQIKQVDNILKKLGKKWDKILAGKGK